MTESGAYAPPPSAPHTPHSHVSQFGRRSMAPWHLVSVAIALVVTPVGILLFDYGAGQYLRTRAVYLEGNSGTFSELAPMALGGLLLAGVAATARLSGLGPIVAGFVWGLLPLLWFVIDVRSFFDVMQDLPLNHFWFASPPFLFGLVAALLVGSGAGGRWRGAQL